MPLYCNSNSVQEIPEEVKYTGKCTDGSLVSNADVKYIKDETGTCIWAKPYTFSRSDTNSDLVDVCMVKTNSELPEGANFMTYVYPGEVIYYGDTVRGFEYEILSESVYDCTITSTPSISASGSIVSGNIVVDVSAKTLKPLTLTKSSLTFSAKNPNNFEVSYDIYVGDGVGEYTSVSSGTLAANATKSPAAAVGTYPKGIYVFKVIAKYKTATAISTVTIHKTTDSGITQLPEGEGLNTSILSPTIDLAYSADGTATVSIKNNDFVSLKSSVTLTSSSKGAVTLDIDRIGSGETISTSYNFGTSSIQDTATLTVTLTNTFDTTKTYTRTATKTVASVAYSDIISDPFTNRYAIVDSLNRDNSVIIGSKTWGYSDDISGYTSKSSAEFTITRPLIQSLDYLSFRFMTTRNTDVTITITKCNISGMYRNSRTYNMDSARHMMFYPFTAHGDCIETSTSYSLTVSCTKESLYTLSDTDYKTITSKINEYMFNSGRYPTAAVRVSIKPKKGKIKTANNGLFIKRPTTYTTYKTIYDLHRNTSYSVITPNINISRGEYLINLDTSAYFDISELYDKSKTHSLILRAEMDNMHIDSGIASDSVTLVVNGEDFVTLGISDFKHSDGNPADDYMTNTADLGVRMGHIAYFDLTNIHYLNGLVESCNRYGDLLLELRVNKPSPSADYGYNKIIDCALIRCDYDAS